MRLTPIVLFVYNRPNHTEKTLTALMNNFLADQSILYIFSDGPKFLADEDEIKKIKLLRSIIRREKWCKKVFIKEFSRNQGLVDSIINGVTEIVNEYGRIIVLEDDIVTNRGFLSYMNEALELYKDDEEVMHISGYMYPVNFKSKSTTFFLQVYSCWGWGTWKRAWDCYNHNVEEQIQLINKGKNLKRKFDIEGHANLYKQLVKNNNGRMYTWAVRWYASWFLSGGISLFPKFSLVQNIGHDGTGVHCTKKDIYNVKTADYLIIDKIPIKENYKTRKSVDLFFKKHFPNKGKFKKLFNKLKKKAIVYSGLIRPKYNHDRLIIKK